MRVLTHSIDLARRGQLALRGVKADLRAAD